MRDASEHVQSADGEGTRDAGPVTAAAAARALARAFRDLGLDTPEKDARVLVEAALEAGGGEIVRNPDRLLSPEAWSRLAAWSERRGAGEPVSRILGRRDFYGRTFHLATAALDPRPETETIIEAVLELVGERNPAGRGLRILDVGIGSGAILGTLLAELPEATGCGTDVSRDALFVARGNLEALGVAGRADLLERRSLAGVEGSFDILVSNPPYVATGDIATLPREVRDFDPPAALDGGVDGLDIYRELASGLLPVLPQGWAVFEVGAGQAEAVIAILSEALGSRLRSIRTWTDLGGHVRCVAVQTHS